ncbi:hypothetical protein TUSST3_75500 [Streptomyces sp. TUS-ST3]|nr:hypothetical protein TUSST3_75500 [Streptomyces sp. TUS-ST3]
MDLRRRSPGADGLPPPRSRGAPRSPAGTACHPLFPGCAAEPGGDTAYVVTDAYADRLRRDRLGRPHRARGDGLTFLDVLRAQAPFASPGVFVQVVRALAGTWVAAGLLSDAERDRVITAAQNADLRR